MPSTTSYTSSKRADLIKTLKGLVVIPAYNEEGNIAKTIAEVRSFPAAFALDILVISDGSTDRTVLEAERSGVYVIDLPFNLGIGGAVQTGFQFALERGYDFVVRVDGDGQHDIQYFQTILDPVLDGAVDMTIGSRFIPPFVGYRSSFVRRIGINFFAQLISFITQYKVTDPTSGFCAYNKRMIKFFAKEYPQDFPEPEAIVLAGRLNARVQEVPVQMRKRAKGLSSIRYFMTLYYMIKVTCAILLVKLKHPKLFKEE